MATPQFNKNKSVYDWYSLTYQSNEQLNKETHQKIKVLIAEVLVKKIRIQDIHSYVHGSIIFSINTKTPVVKFDNILEELKKPFAYHTPPLLLSLVLAAKGSGTSPVRFMYVDGDADMDTHFKTLIIEFYPPKPANKTFFIKKT